MITGVAVSRSSTATKGTDFYMYYQSGQIFAEGGHLYKNPETGAPFVYPPFAAFLFQAFGFAGPSVSISLCFILNFFLTLGCSWCVYKIIEHTGFSKKTALFALCIALVFSVSHVWNNINFSQINTLILFLTLTGILSFLNGKTGIALVLFSAGAWIKVLPVLFVIWALLRDFKLKNMLVVAGVSLFCAGLPFIQRGPSRGMQDAKDFYTDFFRENMVDDVNTIWRNQSLSAAVTRAFVPGENDEKLDYHWIGLPPETVSLIITVMKFLLMLIAFGWVLFKKRKSKPVTIFEIALIYVMVHLISGITWRGHLLSLLFIFTPLFVLRPGALRSIHRLFLFSITGWFTFLLIAVRQVVPETMYMYIHGWSLLTWGLLAMYGYFLYADIKGAGYVNTPSSGNSRNSHLSAIF